MLLLLLLLLLLLILLLLLLLLLILLLLLLILLLLMPLPLKRILGHHHPPIHTSAFNPSSPPLLLQHCCSRSNFNGNQMRFGCKHAATTCGRVVRTIQ